jgi:hypothetical protein
MEKRLSTEKKRRSPLLFFTYYHIYPSLFFFNIEKHVSAILYKNEIRVKVFFLFFFRCVESSGLFSLLQMSYAGERRLLSRFADGPLGLSSLF